MTMKEPSRKPVCENCGKAYGERDKHTEQFQWACKTKTVPTYSTNNLTKARRESGSATVLDGEPPPPPPYRGNEVVVSESKPHFTGKQMSITRTLWDGMTWRGGYDPFCTLRCALAFARASHKAGYRITRRRK